MLIHPIFSSRGFGKEKSCGKVKTLCFCAFLFFPPEHGSHGIPFPLLLPQHAVQILVIAVTGQWLLGFDQSVLQLLVLHLTLSQPKTHTDINQ